MLGTCLIHTFVVEDEKEEKRKLLESLIKKEQMQEQEIVFARYMAYIDPLTGVKNKASYIDEVGIIITSGYSDFHAGKADSFMRVFERADKNMYKCKKSLKS